MTNELAPKAATNLIRKMFEAKGVAVTHTEALDLLARLNGYKGWSHQSKALPNLKTAKTAKVPKVQPPKKVPRMLSLEEVLRSHYAEDAQCPQYLRSDWQYQVDNEDTAVGYWEWVPQEALGRDEGDLLQEYRVPAPLTVTSPNGTVTTWDIEINLTDRWGDLNDFCAEQKPGLAILRLDQPLLEFLRAEMYDEITFVSRKNNEFGLLFEVEFCSRESESGHDSGNLELKPHAEVKAALLKGLTTLENKFPSVQFAVPDENHVALNRPAVWAFMKQGTLSFNERRALSHALLDM